MSYRLKVQEAIRALAKAEEAIKASGCPVAQGYLLDVTFIADDLAKHLGYQRVSKVWPEVITDQLAIINAMHED